MPKSRRRWTDEEIATLRQLAQEFPVATIAAALGGSSSAVVIKARELKLALKTKQGEQL